MTRDQSHGATDRRDFLQMSGAIVAGSALAPLMAAARGPMRAPKALRVGIAGQGVRGRALAAAFARIEGVSVVAIADPDKARLRRGRRSSPEAQPFVGLEEMTSSELKIDALAIATPTHLHRAHLDIALRTKAPIYCEAPMAHTLEDARAMAEAAVAAQRPVQFGHVGRANPIYTRARSFMRSGTVETLLRLESQWREKVSWRSAARDPDLERARNWRLRRDGSAGLLSEVGSHQLDVFDWFVRKAPKSVRARGGVRVWKDGREHADTVNAVFDYGEGLELAMAATLGGSYGGSRQNIVGTMGTVVLADTHGWLFKEADAPVQGWEVYASRQQFHQDQGITLIADATKLAAQGKLKEGIGLPYPPESYAVEAFVKACAYEGGVTCDAKTALKSAAWSLGAYEALRSGEEFVFDPATWTL